MKKVDYQKLLAGYDGQYEYPNSPYQLRHESVFVEMTDFAVRRYYIVVRGDRIYFDLCFDGMTQGQFDQQIDARMEEALS